MQLNTAQKLFQSLRPKLGPYVAEQVVRNCVAYAEDPAKPWRPSVEAHLSAMLGLSCIGGLTSQVLGAGFLWDETPQGFAFWERAHSPDRDNRQRY